LINISLSSSAAVEFDLKETIRFAESLRRDIQSKIEYWKLSLGAVYES